MLGCVALALLMLAILIKTAPNIGPATALGMIALSLIFCAGAGYLILLLKKLIMGDVLSAGMGKSDSQDSVLQESFSRDALVISYLVVAVLVGGLLIQLDSLRNWIGAVCSVMSLSLLGSSVSLWIVRRRSDISFEGEDAQHRHDSRAEKSVSDGAGRNILVMGLLAIVTIGGAASFIYEEKLRSLSGFDLIGFLLLQAACAFGI